MVKMEEVESNKHSLRYPIGQVLLMLKKYLPVIIIIVQLKKILEVFCWGNPTHGEIGNGSNSMQKLPNKLLESPMQLRLI